MSYWRELADRNRLLTHVPLGPLTTYKLGGPARLLVEVEDADDLVSLALLVEQARRISPESVPALRDLVAPSAGRSVQDLWASVGHQIADVFGMALERHGNK